MALATGYIEKPINPETVAAEIMHYLPKNWENTEE